MQVRWAALGAVSSTTRMMSCIASARGDVIYVFIRIIVWDYFASAPCDIPVVLPKMSEYSGTGGGSFVEGQ